MLKILNTLTRQKEDFLPQNYPQVRMYTCGVTVYDSCHIGHARSLYIFDVMRRYLKYRGYDVKFVRNITDIDDKIINRANELKTDWKSLVEKYIASYYEDLLALGVDKADFEPRATENILDMIKYIEALIQKGYAYTSGGDVYFDVRKFPGYGKLSRQNIEEMETGVRIEPTSLKKDPLDFALWKASKEGEPYWDSPWGKGRPGWHIECSVMSQKFLQTETLDIHAGGRDLIFPHHDNEVAQAEAYSGKPFAKYWIHHGLLTINGQKMSKSLGNFVTIHDFIKKYKDADLLKIFFLSAHYSRPVDYTNEKIEEAKRAYERIDNLMQKLEQRYGVRKVNAGGGTDVFGQFKLKFDEYMDDDFNAPRALSVLFDMVSECNIIFDSDNKDKDLKLIYAMDIIKEMADVLGLAFLKKVSTTISEDEISSQISTRA
ncbi:MAG: cysteine--tRNA ligase, partial [Candidatus Omnitrophota bacterium]